MTTRTVLLVEDDLDVRDTLQDLLESEGFDVIPAANGKQAIDFLTLNDPAGADLVILDLMMPMVSGWEVLEVMTDSVIGGDRVRASPAGRHRLDEQGFVHKPFALETLVAAIRGCLPDNDGAPAFN